MFKIRVMLEELYFCLSFLGFSATERELGPTPKTNEDRKSAHSDHPLLAEKNKLLILVSHFHLDSFNYSDFDMLPRLSRF